MQRNLHMIAASLLSSNLACLSQEAERLLCDGVDQLHMDIMDGHFVDNITFGPCVIKSLCKRLTENKFSTYIDCHLMVENPKKWIKMFADAGASQITFHIESITKNKHAHDLIGEIIKLNMQVGVAISPKTPIEHIYNILQKFESKIYMVLIMTVEPGFWGQKFIYSMLERIKNLHDKFPGIIIGVDGGINIETAKLCSKAGAKIFISGSFLNNDNFNLKLSRKKVILNMRKAILFPDTAKFD